MNAIGAGRTLHADRPHGNKRASIMDGCSQVMVTVAGIDGRPVARTRPRDDRPDTGHKTVATQLTESEKEPIPVGIGFNREVTVDSDLNTTLTGSGKTLTAVNTAASARPNLLIDQESEIASDVTTETSNVMFSAQKTTRTPCEDVLTERDIFRVDGLAIGVTNTRDPSGVDRHEPWLSQVAPGEDRSFVCLFVRSPSVVAVGPRTRSWKDWSDLPGGSVNRPALIQVSDANRETSTNRQSINITTGASVAVGKE